MRHKLTLATLILFLLLISQSPARAGKQLTDDAIQYIINTLPRMVPQLRDEGILVSQAYYIWPSDAALHATGAVLLEEYGYDALQLEALKVFCKAWFCVNYESLITERRQILSSTEEQMTENPYLTDDHKRVNIRIINKALGANKQQLMESVGESNLKKIRVYRDKIEEVWDSLN